MAELLIEGKGTGMLPEAEHVEAARTKGGLVLTVKIKGNAVGSTETIKQTWRVQMTADLARELSRKLLNELGGRDATDA
jgi:hypothetical protein